MMNSLKPYDEYKSPGLDLEWLGDIPSHWQIALNQRIFKEKARPHNGKTETQLSLSQRDGLIATSDMQERSLQTSTYDNWKVTIPGDLVVNRFKAHLGVFFASTLRGIVSFHYGVFAPRVDLVTKYYELLYHTIPYRTIYAGRSNGMTVGLQNLSNQNFYNVRSVIPPLDEQTAIVRFLDHVDRRIRRYMRAKRRLITLLNEQKQAIIHRVVTRGLDPNVRLKPSGLEWLGDVPEHWKVNRIKYLMKVVDRRSEKGTEVLLSMRKYHGLVPYHEHFSKPPQAADLKGFKIIEKGQIAVNRMQAGFGLIFASPQEGLVSPDFGVFQPTGEVLPEFLGELFRSRIVRAKFHAESKGLGTGKSGFMRLYDDRIGWIHIAYPPTINEQTQILDKLAEGTAECDRLIHVNEHEISLLQEYRTRLVTDIVTGKLDVREVAACLPDDVGEAEPVEETDLIGGDGDEDNVDAESEEADP